jgi:hypothetical protein
MSHPDTAVHQPHDNREGLSPSPGASSPGVVTIADILEIDDDDIEFEPSTEHSGTSDGMEEEDEDDGDEYVGKAEGILVSCSIRGWLEEDAPDDVSGVEIEFSVADGNIDEPEEEDTETEQTPDIFRQGNDAVRGMTTLF